MNVDEMATVWGLCEDDGEARQTFLDIFKPLTTSERTWTLRPKPGRTPSNGTSRPSLLHLRVMIDWPGRSAAFLSCGFFQAANSFCAAFSRATQLRLVAFMSSASVCGRLASQCEFAAGLRRVRVIFRSQGAEPGESVLKDSKDVASL